MSFRRKTGICTLLFCRSFFAFFDCQTLFVLTNSLALESPAVLAQRAGAYFALNIRRLVKLSYVRKDGFEPPHLEAAALQAADLPFSQFTRSYPVYYQLQAQDIR